jgi:hypothetical protein
MRGFALWTAAPTGRLRQAGFGPAVGVTTRDALAAAIAAQILGGRFCGFAAALR